ncbi:MAG: amidohydrolase family protein [Desulfurococcales archaeon]|nr:amidohydrolase family protein [Desulfurococcales archaeon]
MLYFRLGGILYGEQLEFKSDVCLSFNSDCILEGIETHSSCPLETKNASSYILLPSPANSHTHLADWIIPEYGTDLSLEELVAPPNGLKHVHLKGTSVTSKTSGYVEALNYAETTGTLLIMDYREEGIDGCMIARKALLSSKFKGTLKILGRPNGNIDDHSYLSSLISKCDGFGLPSPLYYSEETLKDIAKLSVQKDIIVSAHIAETREARRQGDFELLLSYLKPAFIVHGTYLSEGDMAILNERNIPVSICPRSVLFHSTGIPPVRAFFDSNVRIMIGSDNAAWSTPDPWIDASILYFIGRSQGIKSREFDLWVLKGLFLNPYVSIGLDPPLIEEGKPIHGVLADGVSTGLLRAENKYAGIIKRVDRRSIVSRFSCSRFL